MVIQIVKMEASETPYISFNKRGHIVVISLNRQKWWQLSNGLQEIHRLTITYNINNDEYKVIVETLGINYNMTPQIDMVEH